MLARGVLFDAFGTLLKIQNGRHPYRKLIRLGMAHDRRPKPDDIEVLMKQPLTLTGAAYYLGIEVSPEDLAFLEDLLSYEIACIDAYPDGLQAVELLQGHGVRIGVCSNLAFPYAAAIQRCYPGLDAYALSCELGVMKPESEIYRHACEKLGLESQHVCMIGDSQVCDRDGPAACGIRGFFLDRRDGTGDFSNLMDFAKMVSEG